VRPSAEMELRDVMNTWTMLAFHRLSKHPHMITADSQATIRETMQLMYDNNILSVPVMKNSCNPPTAIGFVDMFDVLSYLLELWNTCMHSTHKHPERTLQSLFLLDQQFLHHPIEDLPDRSDNDLFAAVAEEESSLRLLKLYGLGVHRVALVDVNGDVRTVISQSDFITFLNNSKHLFSEVANKTVKELGLVKADELVLIDNDQPTISAFKKLAEHNISAAPIVNSQGSLSGTLSVSDLRALRQDSLASLLQPVRDFKENEEVGAINVACSPNDTLSHVLTTLATAQLHRVWVTDADNTPISVISLTSICDCMAALCGVN